MAYAKVAPATLNDKPDLTPGTLGIPSPIRMISVDPMPLALTLGPNLNQEREEATYPRPCVSTSVSSWLGVSESVSKWVRE